MRHVAWAAAKAFFLTIGVAFTLVALNWASDGGVFNNCEALP